VASVDKISALYETAMFRDLERHDVEVLAERASEVRLDRGQVLFVAGEPARGMYVVASGAVRAYRESADGREQVIHVERAGSTVGEVPLFDEGTYPSTVAAEEDTVLLYLDRADVRRLCLERPQITLAALKLMAHRLRQTAALIESLSLRDVDRRLARLLLLEARMLGDRTGAGLEFEYPLTHQQIAARIGSVREVVSRAMGRLQQHQLIRVDGRRIVVPEERALAAYALE
jgi:CRP-like cAMP-binding protein